MEAKVKVPCAAKVYDNISRKSYPCMRPANIMEDGKDWCGTHAPSAVTRRREKSSARWKARIEADQRRALIGSRFAQEHAEMRGLIERMSKYAEYVHRLALQRQTVEDFEMGRDLADLAGTVSEAQALLSRIGKP